MFIPSAITIAWCYRSDSNLLKKVIGISCIFVFGVFIFGWIRMRNQPSSTQIKVGLAVLEEKMHSNSNHPEYQREKKTALAYEKEITTLATRGAKVVLLPERAIGLDSRWADSVNSIISNTARKNRVFVIVGNTRVNVKTERNSALVFDANGSMLVDYTKKYLIPGLESQFISGSKLGLFEFNGYQSGVAICKDMDFHSYLRKYGKESIRLLFVPAWDFGVDDWLHSRMAILRSVENGFSQIRCARRGRLTINDSYGRITLETTSSNGKSATLIGIASVQSIHTFYIKYGDWFGFLNLLATIGICVFIAVKSSIPVFFS
jgi:apolipoprotein N-acyltransferase